MFSGFYLPKFIAIFPDHHLGLKELKNSDWPKHFILFYFRPLALYMSPKYLWCPQFGVHLLGLLNVEIHNAQIFLVFWLYVFHMWLISSNGCSDSLSWWEEKHDEASPEDDKQLLLQYKRIEWTSMDDTFWPEWCRSPGHCSQAHRSRPTQWSCFKRCHLTMASSFSPDCL